MTRERESGEQTKGQETREQTKGQETREQTKGHYTREQTVGQDTREQTVGQETGVQAGERKATANWERMLEEESKELRGAPVPAERLDAAIRAGIRQAQAARRPARRLSRTALRATAAAAMAMLLLAGSIRVFPTFAEAVSRLPGMDAIVQLIQQDSGLETAIRNDYYEPVDVSDTHEGVTLQVDGVIRDAGRLVIFYTVIVEEGFASSVELDRMKFRLADGSYYEGGYGWSAVNMPERGKGGRMVANAIDVHFSEWEMLPDEFTFETSLHRAGSKMGPTWSIPLQFEPRDEASLRTVFPLNHTVTIEGQRMTVEQAVLHPTRISVDVTFDPDNEKRIFSFLDLQLIGDGGEVYTERSSMHIDEWTRRIYFEGSSFAIPESLVLTGSAARAVDERLELVVDTKRVAVLEAPSEAIALEAVTELGEWLELRFSLAGIAPDDNMLYSVVESEFQDAEGRTYVTGNSSVYGGKNPESADETVQTLAFRIPAEAYAQPLRFGIFNYPQYIREPFELRIR